MATKRTYRPRKANRTKKPNYSVKERFAYHYDRDMGCGKYGLEFGGPKHCYSSGFHDAFSGHNNTVATRHEFGNKSGNAYQAGYRVGRKAAMDYLKQTGKQPSNLVFELVSKEK